MADVGRWFRRHVRSELREGQQRPVNRTYYYIDYRQTIDAIKWRVYKIDKDMQGTAVPANEKKEYFCGRCKAEYTQMEVLDTFGPQGFICQRCGNVLTHDYERVSGGHQKSTRMNNQFKFITELLPKIDSVVVPECTFDLAFEKRRPVVRDATHQIAQSTGADSIYRPTAVKGLANTGPTKIAVEFSSTGGPTEEEKAAELARKEKVAQQNALPSWMSNSTVTGDAFRLDAPGGPLAKGDAANLKDPTVKTKTDAKADADIESYFERMKQQKAEEERLKALQAAEESSDEDDDEDFEDVIATGSNSAGATPASVPGISVTSAPVAPSPLRQSGLKRDASSGPNSATASPGGAGTPGSDGRPVKKVKVEEPMVIDDDSDEDDDEDFEDVVAK